jgi:hypothetical protein
MNVSIVSKKEEISVPGYKTLLTNKRSTLKYERQTLV